MTSKAIKNAVYLKVRNEMSDNEYSWLTDGFYGVRNSSLIITKDDGTEVKFIR